MEEPSASTPEPTPPTNNPVFCSFCGKNAKQVAGIVSAPGVCICTECIVQCCDDLSAYMGVPPAELYPRMKHAQEERRKEYLRAMVRDFDRQAGGPVAVGPPR